MKFLEACKARAKALKGTIPTLYLALKHKQTPVWAKILAAATVAYALSPIDLVPDFIPVLGYLDDLLILPALAALTMKLIPPLVWAECRTQAEGLWAEGKPKRWYYAVPIVVLWLALCAFVVKLIWF